MKGKNMVQSFSENRDATRFDHFSPLHVNDLKSGKIFEARMSNYSDDGIYFESDAFFQKGTKIYISMQNSPYAQSSDVLEYVNGEVIWRKYLKRSFYNYGYGIQLVIDSGTQDTETNYPKAKDLRKHSRKAYFQNILFSTPDGLHTGSTKNISASGVFIATKKELKVGEQLKLNLPLKTGKSAEIIGQIVWANKEGFGLKFKKVK
jgi:Tfp pilus assembly protein PilZ